MTQADKELLLKDLCARLPYGVMAKFGDSNPSKITNITQGIDSDSWFVESEGELDGMMCEINNVKPYLFPLSSMTPEQENEWNNLFHNPLDELFTKDKNGGIERNEKLLLISKSMLDPIQWSYKNHFDILGLIPMGLAIDATGLSVYTNSNE